MVDYKLIMMTINTPAFVEVIIKAMIWQDGFFDSIVRDQSSISTLIFWLLLCYFFEIKQRLSTIFHPKTNTQTER